jgi:transcription antitermination protein NusB
VNAEAGLDAPKRRAARLAAVQALYQMELTGAPAGDVAAEFVAYRFGAEPEITALGMPDEDFFADIVRGVPRLQAEIDAAITASLSQKWRLGRVDSTLRAILRAGVYELIARRDVPAKAAIDEYVRLASGFCTDDETAFVNASLDAIARKIRAGEFGLPPPADALAF